MAFHFIFKSTLPAFSSQMKEQEKMPINSLNTCSHSPEPSVPGLAESSVCGPAARGPTLSPVWWILPVCHTGLHFAPGPPATYSLTQPQRKNHEAQRWQREIKIRTVDTDMKKQVIHLSQHHTNNICRFLGLNDSFWNKKKTQFQWLQQICMYRAAINDYFPCWFTSTLCLIIINLFKWWKYANYNQISLYKADRRSKSSQEAGTCRKCSHNELFF